MAKNSPQDTNLMRKLFLLGGFVLAVSGFFIFDLNQYLSLEFLRNNEAELRGFAKNTPLLAGAIYVLIYVLVVGFSLPGALFLSLTGGLVFGTLLGGILAVSGATIGAAMLFLAARFVAGDYLRKQAGGSLKKFETAFNDNAISYLLVLRLVPLFPFFIVNLGAALVGVRFWVFILTTFVGIIPAGFVIVSIGNGISTVLREGKTPDVALLTRPEIILPLLGLAALSLVPVVYKKYKARPVSQES